MKRSLQVAVCFLVTLMFATKLSACPEISATGYQISFNSEELYMPRSFQVVAGGSENLDYCSQPGTGFVSYAPDIELYFSRNRNYALEFRVESKCDTILLVNTGAGNWYFDDDDNGRRDAKIHLSNPSSGWDDIWIGTYDGNICHSTQIFETF